MSELPTLEINDLEYETEYEIGQDNVEVMGLDVHNPVFFLAASLVVLFSALTLIFPDTAGSVLSSAKAGTLNSFDWLFAVTPVLIFAFCMALCLSPLGRIRLGGPEATPEFQMLSWIAMLFAAGVGVGFMFYGAGEPLSYFYGAYGYATPAYDVPLNAVPGSAEAERLAFSVTIFHWGLAPWAIYAVVGLALGYFAHSKGLPLSIRSAFYPLLGERIWGWPGHLIDLMAVVSTVFGLATTIGIGGTQAAAGIAYVTGIEAGLWLQIALILTMTALAVVSVLRGLDGGVKLLSNINMIIAFGLLLFVMIAGPSLMIVTGLGQNLIAYFADMPALTNWMGREDKAWFHDWTIFYWAWWISWSPFVGMFIARISKGRTVRQYFAVVLLAPFTICAIWFTAFGETAIFQATNDIGALAGGLGESGGSATALFKMLEALPFGMVTSVIAIVLLIVFIVTSADSGALVIDTITSGGKTDAPVIQRVFWACMIGITASALLYGGTSTSALYTLQAGTITAALPFTVILLACCVSLYLGMREEHRTMQAVQEAAPAE